MARIGIEGMEFNALHGLYAIEEKVRSLFILDLYIEFDDSLMVNSDKIADTIDYNILYEVCKKHMGQSVNLLETIAKNICQEIRDTLVPVGKISIKVAKTNPPFSNVVKKTFVEFIMH